MSFIELTSVKTGDTFHVRATSITGFVPIRNEDESKKHTKVWVDGYEVIVTEPPDVILRRIKEGNCAILRALIEKYGVEEGTQRYQAGENPP
jgi:hypothetical protein